MEPPFHGPNQEIGAISPPNIVLLLPPSPDVQSDKFEAREFFLFFKNLCRCWKITLFCSGVLDYDSLNGPLSLLSLAGDI